MVGTKPTDTDDSYANLAERIDSMVGWIDGRVIVIV